MNPYKEFVKLMLPVEVRESFELVKVEVNTYPSDTKTDELGEMHIYLDEESTPPKGSTDWDNMVQEHSRLSPDFVTFLKEIRRELSTDRALLREVLLH